MSVSSCSTCSISRIARGGLLMPGPPTSAACLSFTSRLTWRTWARRKMPSQGMYVNVVKSGSVPKGETESNSTGLRFVAYLRGLYEFEYNNSHKNPVDPATWFQV